MSILRAIQDYLAGYPGMRPVRILTDMVTEDAESYGISGYGEYYGMVAGIKAGNNDVTDIFGDATLRIGSRDYDELTAFLERVAKIDDVEFVFTVSADKEELPKKIFDIAEVC